MIPSSTTRQTPTHRRCFKIHRASDSPFARIDGRRARPTDHPQRPRRGAASLGLVDRPAALRRSIALRTQRPEGSVACRRPSGESAALGRTRVRAMLACDASHSLRSRRCCCPRPRCQAAGFGNEDCHQTPAWSCCSWRVWKACRWPLSLCGGGGGRYTDRCRRTTAR